MGTCASCGTLVPPQLPQDSWALPMEQPLCRTGMARAAGPASCVGTSQGPALPQRWEGGRCSRRPGRHVACPLSSSAVSPGARLTALPSGAGSVILPSSLRLNLWASFFL